MQAQLQQREHLLGAGDHGELLGRHGVDAGHVQHGEQVALDLGPGLLEPELGVDLLDVEAVGHLGRLRADGGAEGIGERVRGIGRQDQGAVSLRGRQRRRTGGDGGLADAALAGEQENSHGPLTPAQPRDSTRFFSPFSAVSIRIFSPLRLSMPMSGIETSSASR